MSNKLTFVALEMSSRQPCVMQRAVDVFLVKFFEFLIFTFTESDDGVDVEVNSDIFSGLDIDLAQLFIF